MKAKKIISFCSMFSLVLILSVYYVLSPISIDMGVSNIEDNEDVNVEIIDGESAYFNNLDVLKETAYLEKLKEFDAIVASKDSSSEEKLEALANKNDKIKVNESEKVLTQMIKEKGYENVYVEYENNNVNILVGKKDASFKDAETIINSVYSYVNQNYVPIVTFKA